MFCSLACECGWIGWGGLVELRGYWIWGLWDWGMGGGVLCVLANFGVMYAHFGGEGGYHGVSKGVVIWKQGGVGRGC